MIDAITIIIIIIQEEKITNRFTFTMDNLSFSTSL